MNFSRYKKMKYFLLFIIIFIDLIMFLLVFAKLLLVKINILSICIFRMPNELKLLKNLRLYIDFIILN